MRDSKRSDSPPGPDRPPATPGFDWIMTVLSAVFISGLFLDGWAHTHGRVDETFFTPWHAVLYGGYLACAVALLGAHAQHAARGYGWRQALPSGYGLSLIGAGLWGPADLLWHTLFGFEADVETLMSPAHLLLAVGAGFILSGPWRSVRERSDGAEGPWWRGLPLVLSLTFVLSEITFFAQIGHPLSNLSGRGPARPAEFAYLLEKCGIVGILLETIISMGAVLLLLRRQPFVGSLTLMLGLNAVAMGFLYGRGPYPLAQVAAFAGGGVVADALRVIIRPTLERPRARTLFAFATPAVLHIFYFLSLKLTHGLWWSVHLWLGAVVLSGLVGCLLAYLLAPESSDQQQARPTGARHRHAERVTDLPPRIGSGVRGHHG
jgi:hypothetical protein